MIAIKDYEKSNKETEVKYKSLSKKEYSDLLNAGIDIKNRKKAGQTLLDYLCDKYKISRIPLKVMNRGRKKTSKGETHGFYKYSPSIKKGKEITIYNLTAVKKDVISIKIFINTLLHEFIHHYDTEFLKIETHHSKGFYLRISDLDNKLK